jgi:hypothetical protein
MKYAIVASSLAAATLATASSYNGGGQYRGPPQGNGAPSCLDSCWNDLHNDNNYADFCNGADLDTLNSCIAASDCTDADKESTYQVIAQGCANAGQTPTASQQATFSVTSGKNSPTPGFSGNHGGPWRGAATSQWISNSDWQSWTSAHPTPTVTDSSAWSSWASSAGWPTASTEWSSWASAQGFPTSLPPFVGGGLGFPHAAGPFSSVVHAV